MKIIYLFIIITLIPLISQKQFLNIFEKKKEAIILASTDLETIRNNILVNHNYHRKRHQVGDLTRNSELEVIAQTYSEKLASTDTFAHSGNTYNGNPLGENLYKSWGSYQVSVTGTEASNSWYEEVKDYDFNNPGFKSGTGHFTQLVWKNSKQLGCGASCQNNACVVTCNYYPAGNYLGQFDSNVFPLKEEQDNSGNGPTNQTFNQTGMNTGLKVFIAILIILVVLVIFFGISLWLRKRKHNDVESKVNKLNNYNRIMV